VRECLTQTQAATAPRTTTPRATHSAGLGEKLTSAYTPGVSGGEPTDVNPQQRLPARRRNHASKRQLMRHPLWHPDSLGLLFP
jgi:hypothetical protein